MANTFQPDNAPTGMHWKRRSDQTWELAKGEAPRREIVSLTDSNGQTREAYAPEQPATPPVGHGAHKLAKRHHLRHGGHKHAKPHTHIPEPGQGAQYHIIPPSADGSSPINSTPPRADLAGNDKGFDELAHTRGKDGKLPNPNDLARMYADMGIETNRGAHRSADPKKAPAATTAQAAPPPWGKTRPQGGGMDDGVFRRTAAFPKPNPFKI